MIMVKYVEVGKVITCDKYNNNIMITCDGYKKNVQNTAFKELGNTCNQLGVSIPECDLHLQL